MEQQRLEASFPHDEIRSEQATALKFIAAHPEGCIIEATTGSGKTAIGWAALKAAEKMGQKGLVYVTPTKTQAEQVLKGYAKSGNNKVALTVLGRAEYECLYYQGISETPVNAEQSPCYMLDCGHRVDQETGETEDEGEEPCPYYQAKFEAKQSLMSGGIVVTTTAFYLMNRLMVSGWREAEVAQTVVDEAHTLPNVARHIFDQTVTDWHLKRVADMIETINEAEAGKLRTFYQAFMAMVMKKASQEATLLTDEQIEKLVDLLKEIDVAANEKSVRAAIRNGTIDPVEDRETLRVLTNFIPGVRRMIRSLQYSMEKSTRRPLNYVVAFHYKKDDPAFSETKKKARYFLTVKSYYVAPIIRKVFSGPTILLSATIGNPAIFGFESGMKQPFIALESTFSAKKTRLFQPRDMPNLSYNKREEKDMKHALRDIVRAAKRFADAGHRSLIVVVSEAERKRVLARAADNQLDMISYDKEQGVSARDAARRFKAGEGSCLVGTAAQYGEGIDLPNGICPVIFFLRPSFPSPKDPVAQFEERRFGEQRWAIWRYRAVLQALQVRGRNIRSAGDMGVCFFISSQFRDFVAGALPHWLRPAYRTKETFDQNIQEALKLLA
ncbi:DEAD/DEAH box helicase [Candidatus Uhrbacteria bacterium]|nr:DEAD/DEAH box helicase [Candidatus Uhrbacteria bacterium]